MIPFPLASLPINGIINLSGERNHENGRQEMAKYVVVERSSVDAGDLGTIRAEFDSRDEADQYIREHAADEHGNLSNEQDCDYLMIEER